MPPSEDNITAGLQSFVAKDDGSDEETLAHLIVGFEELSERQRILTAMFAVMERYPGEDLGSPGPLVHSIEKLPISEYEPLLRSSVQRQPGRLNVWMVNRILNSRLSSQHRIELLTILNAVKLHQKASFVTRQLTERYLEFQAQRESK
jgi:hypothetical protein